MTFMMNQPVEELTSIKTGSEIISKTDIDSQNFISCSGNRMSIRLPLHSLTAVVALPTIIPFKAPCSYLINMKISSMSDTGNTWVFWQVFGAKQVTSGGTITVVAPNSSQIINSGDGTHAASFNQTGSNDALDLNIVTNIGGSVFDLVVWIDVFCNKNF